LKIEHTFSVLTAGINIQKEISLKSIFIEGIREGEGNHHSGGLTSSNTPAEQIFPPWMREGLPISEKHPLGAQERNWRKRQENVDVDATGAWFEDRSAI